MVVVLRKNLAEQVGSTRQGASLVEQQRDSEDSTNESLSFLFDAIVIVMSLLYARVECLMAILSGLDIHQVSHSLLLNPVNWAVMGSAEHVCIINPFTSVKWA